MQDVPKNISSYIALENAYPSPLYYYEKLQVLTTCKIPKYIYCNKISIKMLIIRGGEYRATKHQFLSAPGAGRMPPPLTVSFLQK